MFIDCRLSLGSCQVDASSESALMSPPSGTNDPMSIPTQSRGRLQLTGQIGGFLQTECLFKPNDTISPIITKVSCLKYALRAKQNQ